MLSESGCQTYKDFIALKLHFTEGNYDYFKFQGRTGASFASYQRRKDAFSFEKLYSQYGNDVILFMAFNLANDPNLYPKLMLEDSKCEDFYFECKKEIDSVSYRLTELAKQYNLYEILKLQKPHPMLVKLIIVNKVSIAMASIIDSCVNYVPLYDNGIEENIVWPIYSSKIKKIKPFIKLDKENVKNKFVDLLKNGKKE